MPRRNGQANGNGNIHGVRETSTSTETEENIFLFIPNLIGIPSSSVLTFLRHPLTSAASHRLRTRYSRHRISILHAPPPPHMFCTLQCIMYSRCSRWLCCATIQAVHKVWCGLRH